MHSLNPSRLEGALRDNSRWPPRPELVKNLVNLDKRGSVGDLAVNKHGKVLHILYTYCTPGTSVSISDSTHWLLWEAGRNVPIHIKLLGQDDHWILELSDLIHTQICLAFNLLSPGP